MIDRARVDHRGKSIEIWVDNSPRTNLQSLPLIETLFCSLQDNYHFSCRPTKQIEKFLIFTKPKLVIVNYNDVEFIRVIKV